MKLPAPFPPTNWILFGLKKAEAGTAPFDVSNSTKQADSNYQFNRECNYNLFECSCALACPAGGASGRAWFFFRNPFGLPICIKAKRTEIYKNKRKTYLFFLLLVQKKVTKKSTPAMIYSHYRTPWLNFSATVNWAKQFLSSTSTIVEVFLFPSILSVKWFSYNIGLEEICQRPRHYFLNLVYFLQLHSWQPN